MNELDLIRAFRADVPPPTTLARARARRALHPREQRPSRRPAARLTVALGVIAFAIAVGVTLRSDDDRLGTPSAQAAETLRQAAVAIEADGLRAPRADEYVYLRSRESYVNDRPRVRESWMAPDGPLRVRERHDSGRIHVMRFPTSTFYFGERNLSYAQLLTLPTDPQQLYARIRAAAMRNDDNPIDANSFSIVSDVLRYAPLPADLQAAFYRAAALIPGVLDTDRVEDAAGRAGVGVSHDDPHRRQTLIFDPSSHRLLGNHETLFKPTDTNAPTGPTVNDVAYLQQAIVPSPHARP